MRELCRTDLYFLLRYALRITHIEKPWLFDRCREVQESPDSHIDIWSREHFKSTIITFGKTIQDILSSHGDDPLPKWGGREITVGIFSYNRPAAKVFLVRIKRELEENTALKALFPDVLYADPKKESPKWNEDDGIIVKRKSNPQEPTVDANGLVDGQPTGMHYFIRVYDDVVTLESARSREMILKTTQAWGMSLYLGCDGGLERYAGTFYCDGETYQEIIDRGAAKLRKYPATHDGSSSGHPVLWSQEYFDTKKKSNFYDFSCQVLCDPIPSDSAYFPIENFQWYEEPPKHLRKYGASDHALTEGGGDWTEIGICGIDPNDDLYILDWWSGQTTMDKWMEEILDFVRVYKPVMWASESGQIRRSMEPYLNRRMNERRDYIRMEWLPTIADKPSMCRSFQARTQQRKVYLPKKPWAEDLVRQLTRFPKGKLDDKVDVCGLFGRILDKMHSAVIPGESDQPLGVDSYGFDNELEEEWKTA